MARNPALAALPRFHRGCFWLFLTVFLTTILLADRPQIAGAMLLGPGFGGELQLWQPLTALFLFPEGQLGGLFLTLLVQWIVGGPVEARRGTRRYLAFVLGCALVGTLVTALAGLAIPAIAAVTIGGSLPIDLAALVAFGVLRGRAPLRLFGALPITARTLAILAAVLAIVSPLARGAPWPVILPSIVTLLTAFLVASWPTLRARRLRRRHATSKAHLQLVKSDKRLLN